MEISPQLHTDLLLPCSISNFRLPWDTYEASLLKGCETVQGLLRDIKVNAKNTKPKQNLVRFHCEAWINKAMVAFTYSCANQLESCWLTRQKRNKCHLVFLCMHELVQDRWSQIESRIFWLKSEHNPHQLVIKIGFQVMEFQLDSVWDVIAPLSPSFLLNNITICSFTPDRDNSLKVQKASPVGFVYISKSKGDDAHVQNGPECSRSAAQVCGCMKTANSIQITHNPFCVSNPDPCLKWMGTPNPVVHKLFVAGPS